MAWDILEILENVFNVLNLFDGSSQSSAPLNYKDISERKKKSKYFTEIVSSGFIVLGVILLFLVFKDPLPENNYIQTLIVISLMGSAASGILFFILNVLELYYFKSLFKMLLFSGSVILFFIALFLYIYFKSGLFL